MSVASHKRRQRIETAADEAGGHATVRVSGYEVPMVGVPPSAMLQECCLCHDLFPLGDVEWDGRQALCRKCRKE